MRLIYPQDRIAYVYKRAGDPIIMPGRVLLTVYLDEECTQLADIQDLEALAVPQSRLYVGADGLVPEFYGPPDGTALLWVLAGESVVPYKIDAQPGPRISAVEQAQTRPIAYVHDQLATAGTWSIAHNLGFRPGGVTVQDTAGTTIIGADVTYIDDNNLQLNFSPPLSGKAYLS